MSCALLDRAIDACGFPPGLQDAARVHFTNWELVPYCVGDATAGCALIKGSEIHVVLFPEFRHGGLQKDRVRAFMRPLLRRTGFLTTSVAMARRAQRRFVERIGFQYVTDNGRDAFYVCHQVPETGVLHDNRSQS